MIPQSEPSLQPGHLLAVHLGSEEAADAWRHRRAVRRREELRAALARALRELATAPPAVARVAPTTPAVAEAPLRPAPAAERAPVTESAPAKQIKAPTPSRNGKEHKAPGTFTMGRRI